MKRICLITLLMLLLSACSSEAPLLTEAPVLRVSTDKASIEASYGTSSWTYDNTDGTTGGYEADGKHPLETLVPTIRDAGVTATLDFGPVPPDEITVQCWHYSFLGHPDAPPTALTVTDSTVPLLPDGYVYEVFAKWSSYENFSGNAYYAFYAVDAPAIPDCYVGPEWPPLKEPPQMSVIVGDITIEVGHSSAQWDYDEDPEDDLAAAVISCGDHPLNCKDTMPRLPVTGASADLVFSDGRSPDVISIRCWSTDHWGNPEAPAESITAKNGTFQLRDNGTVYEITAVWNHDGTFGGEASYCFVAE